MACRARQRGFTMIELVTVMILVGILAFVAIPRISGNEIQERGFHDAVVTVIAHARRVAVSSRRFVCVAVDGAAGRVALTRDERPPESVPSVSCTATVPLPATSSGCPANAACAPSGIILNNGAAAAIIFDPLGRSVTATKAVASPISIATAHAAITVQPGTGYVQ